MKSMVFNLCVLGKQRYYRQPRSTQKITHNMISFPIDLIRTPRVMGGLGYRRPKNMITTSKFNMVK